MNELRNPVHTFRELVNDATLLIRQEIALAKAESEEKLSQLQVGVVAVAAGLLLAFTALLVLVQALVAALSNIMAPSLAALLVGVVLAIIAYIAVKSGQEHLKPENLAPRRTARSIRESAQKIRETV